MTKTWMVGSRESDNKFSSILHQPDQQKPQGKTMKHAAMNFYQTTCKHN